MGGIFAGIFTPTEGAGIGAGTAIIIAAVSRRLSFMDLVASLKDTTVASARIYLIVMGTVFYQFFMEASRVPDVLSQQLVALNLDPYLLMVVIIIFVALLGCVMEGLGILFLTVPVLFPVVTALGFDPIWFGVIMVLMVELGLITPPLGLNIFVLTSVAPQISLSEAFSGIWIFAAAILLVAVLILLVPQTALFLPNLLMATP